MHHLLCVTAVTALLVVAAALPTAADGALTTSSLLASLARASSEEASVAHLSAMVLGHRPIANSNSVKLASGLLLNELQSPGQRAAQRFQQLALVGGDVQSGGCASYTYTPGGAPVNAKWTGPTFTLTQTTGSCIVVPEFAGGNAEWTQLKGTLACLGPSTQWGWTPVTYEGPSREPTTLEGPSCKYEYRFGRQTGVRVSGENSRTKYSTEKEFYAAAALEGMLAGDSQVLRVALAELDSEAARHAFDRLVGGSLPVWRNVMQQRTGTIAALNSRTVANGLHQLDSIHLMKGASRWRGIGSRTMLQRGVEP